MLEFLAGMIVGGVIGVFIAALCAAASTLEDARKMRVGLEAAGEGDLAQGKPTSFDQRARLVKPYLTVVPVRRRSQVSREQALHLPRRDIDASRDCVGGHRADMVGGGPFRLKPGEWTDDTAMALALTDKRLSGPWRMGGGVVTESDANPMRNVKGATRLARQARIACANSQSLLLSVDPTKLWAKSYIESLKCSARHWLASP